MSKTNRREFLARTASLVAIPLIYPVSSLIASPDYGSSRRSMFNPQPDWRYCEKCYGIFWNGFADKGRCPAGGGHKNPVGDNYFLPTGDGNDTPKTQSRWRWCDKCYALFFAGYAPQLGKCPAGGGHNGTSGNSVYRLPHDVPADGTNRAGYRFCTKCYWMFWDGYNTKGNCPGGGAHTAAGHNFVLPHDLPQTYSTRVELRTDGWAPIEGWTEIWCKSNGDFSFKGHIHNSGGINIRFTLGAALVSPTGQSFGFAAVSKKVEGTQVLINPERNYNWENAGNDPQIAHLWADIHRSKTTTKLVASSAITGSDIKPFLKSLAEVTLNAIYNASPGLAQSAMYPFGSAAMYIIRAI